MENPCESCPKVLNAQALNADLPDPRFCFDCPRGYVRARFAALFSRDSVTVIRSCRKSTLSV